MSIEKSRENLQNAANILKSNHGGKVADAFSIATDMSLELDGLPGIFARQEEIKTEAQHRVVRIQAQLEGIRQEMGALYGLFDEGVEGGRKITTHSESTTQKLGSAEEKVYAATNLVDQALDDGSSLRLFYPINQQEILLGDSLPALGRVGQRHEQHFETAKHSGEKLGKVVSQLDEDFTYFHGLISGLGVAQHQYDQMAEQGEPQRTVQESTKLAASISVTADEIRSVVQRLD